MPPRCIHNRGHGRHRKDGEDRMKRICTTENLLDRLATQITVGDDCWLWTGTPMKIGYARIVNDGRRPYVHALMYELLIGPVPSGMTLDHLCHTNDPACPGGNYDPHRRCVRPSHLEPVTLAENKARGRSPHAVHARKSHCPQGHPYDNTNTYRVRRKNGNLSRVCRKCCLDGQRRRRLERARP